MPFDWFWKDNHFLPKKEEKMDPPKEEYFFVFRPQKDISTLELAYILGSFTSSTKVSLFTVYTIVPKNQEILGPSLMRHFKKVDSDTVINYEDIILEMKENLKNEKRD